MSSIAGFLFPLSASLLLYLSVGLQINTQSLILFVFLSVLFFLRGSLCVCLTVCLPVRACVFAWGVRLQTLLAQEVTQACFPTGGAFRLVPPCAEGSRSSRPTPRLAWLASGGVWDSV